MKKEEFLKELEHRLNILNDSEKKDLIEEYAQHIDIKISNGLSEEAAVADFGNIKELADEILSAYSVNLKYNRPDVIGKSKNILVKVSGKILDKLKKIGRKIITTTKKITNSIKCEFVKIKNNIFKKEKNNSINESAEKIKEEKKFKFVLKQNRGERTGKGRNLMKKAIVAIWNFTKRAFVCVVKVGIIIALAPFIGVSFIGLIALGFLFVMLIQGYPVIGLTVIALGGCIFTIAFILGVIDICFTKKKKTVAFEEV